MAKRHGKNSVERQVFDSIRKPTAPPGHRLGSDRPEGKAHPSLRKVKHKKRVETDEG